MPGGPKIPHQRVATRLRNGAAILDGVDGRTYIARRYREITASLASDLGGDLTEAQLHLARTTAGLVCLREALDTRLVSGEKVAIEDYTRLANSLRRCLTTLGLARVARDVTPDLSTYLASKGRQVGRARIIDVEAEAAE